MLLFLPTRPTGRSTSTNALMVSTAGSLDVNTPANSLAGESRFRQSKRARISSRNAAEKLWGIVLVGWVVCPSRRRHEERRGDHLCIQSEYHLDPTKRGA